MDSKNGSYQSFVKLNDALHSDGQCRPCYGFVVDSCQSHAGELTNPDSVIVATVCDIRFDSHIFSPYRHSVPRIKSIDLVSKDEALDHFRQTVKLLGEDMDVGELTGAIAARKRHYVLGTITKLLGAKSPHVESRIIDDPSCVASPGTGLYVVGGYYHSEGTELDHLELVRVTSPIGERTLQHLLLDLHSKGFGSITSRSGDDWTIPGQIPLTGYTAFEVPEDALDLVSRIEPSLHIQISSEK